MFGDGPLQSKCDQQSKRADEIVVPTVVLFEVYRKIARSISEEAGLSAVAYMSQNRVQDLSRRVALSAADLSIEHKLAMADALVWRMPMTKTPPWCLSATTLQAWRARRYFGLSRSCAGTLS